MNLFGSDLLTAVIFLFVIFLIGMKFDWNFTLFVVVLIPFFGMIVLKYVGLSIATSFYFVLAVIIGVALLTLIRT